MLAGKTIVLGVCGGIAAYKAAALTSKLVQAGAYVHVIMTASAQKFVTPLTFQALSKQHVYVDIFDEWQPDSISHISLADSADLIIVAPATANIIAKLAYGLADDMLSTTLLATRAPIFIAPAMNGHMYENPVVQQNIQTISQRGVQFIEPNEGQLACGYVGTGRLAEPEHIVDTLHTYFSRKQIWFQKKVLITAGGTIEKIDPVRYIGNHSSGKMGYHLAEQAQKLGAQVILISAPTALAAPAGVQVIAIQTALDMYDAVMAHMDQVDVIVMAAAVADYRPVTVARQKIKKKESHLTIECIRNPDILFEIGQQKTSQFIVGFAAETEQLEQYAMEKLTRKQCDILVANDVTKEGVGFHTDTNQVSIFDKQGLVATSPLQTKQDIAKFILNIMYDKMTSQDMRGQHEQKSEKSHRE
jgi:phosphopantothenoylcysteine decarboxylase/phosphopantothenate--cysteine ligase